jgi:ABC-type sugar transport system substrate-binding protein
VHGGYTGAWIRPSLLAHPGGDLALAADKRERNSLTEVCARSVIPDSCPPPGGTRRKEFAVRDQRKSALTIAATAALALAAAACASPTPPQSAAPAAAGGDLAAQQVKGVDPNSPMGQTLAFVQAGKKVTKPTNVAFITACTSNTYCQAGVQGATDAAARFGLTMKLYDSNFSSDIELKNAQDATQQGFDGYLFAPETDASGCSVFKLLHATGKPVATDNSPMCGNPGYTPGTVGLVASQTTEYFQQHIEHAFASCTTPCETLVVDQGVESDLYARWETALKNALPKYPNVKVVVDQPTDFDPATTLQVTQDALQKHPNISMVVSYWDDATRGAEQAIVAQGKVPGKDVRIYSMGATRDSLTKITAGTWNETTVLLPYEEAYYAMAQLARKLETGQDTPGYTDLAGAPAVVNGPGTVFITAANAAKFQPRY